jgi:hypothetical protein
MCVGEEALEDGAAVVARRMAEAGASVRWDGYKDMPHCFEMISPMHPHGKKCMHSWENFFKDAIEGKLNEGASKATCAKAFSNPAEKEEIAFEMLKKELSDDELERLLKAKRDRYLEKEERMVKEWRQKTQQRSGGEDPAKAKL